MYGLYIYNPYIHVICVCMYVYITPNHSVVHMKLTQNYKSTILQFFKTLLAEKLKPPSLNLNFSKNFFYVLYLKRDLCSSKMSLL